MQSNEKGSGLSHDVLRSMWRKQGWIPTKNHNRKASKVRRKMAQRSQRTNRRCTR